MTVEPDQVQAADASTPTSTQLVEREEPPPSNVVTQNMTNEADTETTDDVTVNDDDVISHDDDVVDEDATESECATPTRVGEDAATGDARDCANCERWQQAFDLVMVNVQKVSQSNAKSNEVRIQSLHCKMDRIVEQLEAVKAKQAMMLKQIAEAVQQRKVDLATTMSTAASAESGAYHVDIDVDDIDDESPVREVESPVCDSRVQLEPQITLPPPIPLQQQQHQHQNDKMIVESSNRKRPLSVDKVKQANTKSPKSGKKFQMFLQKLLHPSTGEWADGCLVLSGSKFRWGPSKVLKALTSSSRFMLLPGTVRTMGKMFVPQLNRLNLAMPNRVERKLHSFVLCYGYEELMTHIECGALKTLRDASLNEVLSANDAVLRGIVKRLIEFLHYFCTQIDVELLTHHLNKNVAPCPHWRECRLSPPVNRETAVFAWHRIVFVTPLPPPDEHLEVFQQFEDICIDMIGRSDLMAFPNLRVVNVQRMAAKRNYSVQSLMEKAHISQDGMQFVVEEMASAIMSPVDDCDYSIANGNTDVAFCFRCLRVHPAECRSIHRACRTCGECGHFGDVHDISDPVMQYLVRANLNLPISFQSNTLDHLVDDYLTAQDASREPSQFGPHGPAGRQRQNSHDYPRAQQQHPQQQQRQQQQSQQQQQHHSNGGDAGSYGQGRRQHERSPSDGGLPHHYNSMQPRRNNDYISQQQPHHHHHVQQQQQQHQQRMSMSGGMENTDDWYN